MAAVESFLNEDAGAKKRRRKMIFSILIGVVLLHVAAGVIAGIFVVASYIFPPPANFVVKKDIRLPAKKREHKMNMAALDAVAPKPTLSDKMQSTRPTAFSLPDVPDMPLDQMLPLDPSQLVADQVASLSDSDAMGTASGAAAAGSGGFGGQGLSFLGVQSSGQRILLAFDITTSVANKAKDAGIPVEKIREDLSVLISKLPITSRFTIYQFSTNYMPFSTEMVPASPGNKEAALHWIKNEWISRGSVSSGKKTVANPRGIVGIFEKALELKADAIFVVSDGDFNSRKGTFKETGSDYKIPINHIRRAVEPLKEIGCKVNFIMFKPGPENSRELRQISNMTKGTAKDF